MNFRGGGASCNPAPVRVFFKFTWLGLFVPFVGDLFSLNSSLARYRFENKSPTNFVKYDRNNNITNSSPLTVHRLLINETAFSRFTSHFSPLKKPAFTLAEVLITLGIIGIVAAMTLPTVINRANEKQWQVAYKKAYSTIQQAFLRAQENGEIVDITQQLSSSGGAYTSAIGENFKTLSKYIKTTKTCFDNNADECWECDKGQAGRGNAPDWLGCLKGAYAFIDTSGIAWHLYSNIEWPILVDVNGFKNPNKLGKDRFVLMFGSNNDSTPYSSNVTQILPWVDFLYKGRWCPEGNCLYQTWILK